MNFYEIIQLWAVVFGLLMGVFNHLVAMAIFGLTAALILIAEEIHDLAVVRQKEGKRR